jgi:hypothetical protein
VKLPLAILGPLLGKTHLPERMGIAALHQVRVAEEVAIIRVAVSSTAELVLGCSTGKTSETKVISELAGQFLRLEELCSWLEEFGMTI